jgi:hypothetical protein
MNRADPALRFRRERAGRYVATDATTQYVVIRDRRYWRLFICELTTTAGVRHALGQPAIKSDEHDTKGLAVATAQAYSALDDDYLTHQHGHRSRYTEAVRRAYQEDQ